MSGFVFSNHLKRRRLRGVSFIGMIRLDTGVITMNIPSTPGALLRHHRRLIAYFFLPVVNIGLFSWSSPLDSAAWVVFAGFLVASLDLLIIIQLFVVFLCTLAPKLRHVRRRLTIALVSFSVVALALASLGQLTLRDLIVVIIIWLVGYMYSLRFSLQVAKRA
jgi:hypothetical protein